MLTCCCSIRCKIVLIQYLSTFVYQLTRLQLQIIYQ